MRVRAYHWLSELGKCDGTANYIAARLVTTAIAALIEQQRNKYRVFGNRVLAIANNYL